MESAKYKVLSSEVTMHPSSEVTLDAKQATAVLRLLDALEDDDDVQQVYANADIPSEVLELVS